MATRPAYSPWAPEFGCMQMASKPVTVFSHSVRPAIISRIALRLVARGEGVHAAEFRPGDRDHLAGRVQLHGAGAERDHRVVERQILVLQRLQVAQHLVFGVVRVEHRVGERMASVRSRAGCGRPVTWASKGIDVERGLGEELEQRGDVVAGGGFVEGNAEHAGRDAAQVVAGGQGVAIDRFGAGAEVECRVSKNCPVST
jgi:hypothetical protein